jgi:hypothetical protein
VKLQKKLTEHKCVKKVHEPEGALEQWTTRANEPMIAEDNMGLEICSIVMPIASLMGTLVAQSHSAASVESAPPAYDEVHGPATHASEGHLMVEGERTRSCTSSQLMDTNRPPDLPDLYSVDAYPPTASVCSGFALSCVCSRADGQRHVSIFSSVAHSSVSPYSLVPPFLQQFPSHLQPNRAAFKAGKTQSSH